MIEIIGTGLNQWDTGRSVKVTGIEASHVHFANQGDSKAPIMELVNSEAKIPDYLLQTGKQLCVYAVANGVTIERNIFPVKKRERPENYVYEEDQRNYIYELITSAESAVENANHATKNAKEAADKALQAAQSWVMVGDAMGESVTFNDAVTQAFAGFRIFGKTTQDGTPTPDAPVDLVSVGDSGSIAVDVTGKNEGQRMIIATPNGLPGIPVTSGGNYTDANGQQWICDEIDLARGVYVQRVGNKVFDGSVDELWNYESESESSVLLRMELLDSVYVGIVVATDFLCTHFKGAGIYGNDNEGAQHTGQQFYIRILKSKLTTGDVSGFREFLVNSPMSISYVLTTPIETPLSAEEIAAYSALHTYKDHTTVSNDAGAWMELEYVMDAKKYIDSLVAGNLHPATVE